MTDHTGRDSKRGVLKKRKFPEFGGFTGESFGFMKDLKSHNNRPWFEQNLSLIHISEPTRPY